MMRIGTLYLISGLTYLVLIFLFFSFFFFTPNLTILVFFTILMGSAQVACGIQMVFLHVEKADEEMLKILKLLLVLNMLIITGIITNILWIIVTERLVMSIYGLVVLEVMVLSILLVRRYMPKEIGLDSGKTERKRKLLKTP